ncbi:MAG: disulfide bond formation protein B [Beijerinckiaceae bacterium]
MVLELYRKEPALAAVVAILALALATIAGAFVFQALGFAPCDLCFKQRIPYYVGIPVAAFALGFAARGFRGLLPAALILLALIFAGSAIFGAYHAGVEWGFWRGPADCTGTFAKNESMADFLQQLQTVKVVRCDVVAVRILGLSLAGWNAVVSALLVGIAAAGLVNLRRGSK